MFLQTIRSKDKKIIFHGIVTWRNGDEFGFVTNGSRLSTELWCKLDFWELIENEPLTFIVNLHKAN